MSKVKIKAIRDIAVETHSERDGKDVVDRKIIKAGDFAQVTEEEAKMFCDYPVRVTLDSWGPCDKKYKQIYRAERVG